MDDDRAWVKLALLSEGLHPTPAFMSWFDERGQFVRRRNFYNSPTWADGSVNRYPQEIRLAGSPRVTIAVNDYGGSRWALDHVDGRPCVVDRRTGARYPAEMIEDLTTIRSDAAIASTANLYGGSALSFFSPRTCYFFAAGTECRFCSLQGTARESNQFSNRIPPGEVAHAVAAVADGDATALTQVMIVGGNERNLDVGFSKQVDLVHAASEVLETRGLAGEVSVHLIAMPPRDLSLIDRLGNLPNVHAGFNLEVWSPKRFMQVAPGKERDYGQGQIVTALEYLRNVVGPYRAHSILIAGLEDPESTLEGAAELAGREISPIINCYHSDRHSGLGLTVRPTFTQLATVASGLQEIHRNWPVQPYWQGCGRNALDFEAFHRLFSSPIPNELA